MADRYPARKRRNAIWIALAWTATAFGLDWLVLIPGALFWNGFGGLSLDVFTKITSPARRRGRTVEMFVYQFCVVPFGHFSGIAGGLALAVIATPIIVRTTEDMLNLVPNPLREAASALGLPRSLVIKRIAYRAARAGLITGVLLATARVAGETAPLLFTALSNQFFSLDLTKTMANLPVTINNFVQSPYEYWKQLAWSGALIITLTVLALNIGARVLGAERTAK